MAGHTTANKSAPRNPHHADADTILKVYAPIGLPPSLFGYHGNVRLSHAYRIATSMIFAEFILAIHLLIIMFSVSGLFMIPLGARLGWHLVRIAWLRVLHLTTMAIIAGQALMGRACILTIWQARLTGHRNPQPLIMHWLDSLIYWHLPIWFFAGLYTAVFFYALGLTFWVPFGSSTKQRRYTLPRQ